MVDCSVQEVPVALHISGKLCAIGIVLASLITAFSAPPQPEPVLDLVFTPGITVVAEPETVAPPANQGPVVNPVLQVKATGYNSLESQTDSTPNITSTGETTRFGIIAVSRDLLGDALPYGSLVRIREFGSYYNGRGAGRYQERLDSQDLFIVEDTMHPRKQNQVDVWFPHLAEALNWGVRQAEVEIIRYGREGPEFYGEAPSGFEEPTLSVVR